MQMSELRAARDAQPFSRFDLVLSDGHRLTVDHPEVLAIPPFRNSDDRRVIVFERDKTKILDVFHIVRLELPAELNS